MENWPFLSEGLKLRKNSHSFSPSPIKIFIAVQFPGGLTLNPPSLGDCDIFFPNTAYSNGSSETLATLEGALFDSRAFFKSANSSVESEPSTARNSPSPNEIGNLSSLAVELLATWKAN